MKPITPDTEKKFFTSMNYNNIMQTFSAGLLLAMTIRLFVVSTGYEVMKSDNITRDKVAAEFKSDIKESIKELGNKVEGLGERFGRFEYNFKENIKPGP